MAKTTKTTKTTKATKATKGNAKAKKERKPLPELKGDAAAQMKVIESQALHLIDAIDKSNVPVVHLRRYFADFGKAFRAKMSERAGDPVARKRARIAQKLEKLRQELAELESKDSKSKKSEAA